MSETVNETTGTETPESVKATTVWFWWISVDFSRKLDYPKRTYMENGYSETNYETGTGFAGRTLELPSDEASPTRMGFLNYAIDELLKLQNESRRARGETIMFERGDVHVKAFDCGRNEL